MSQATEINYEFLRMLLLQERSQNTLETVDDDFFEKISGFVQMQEKLLGDSFSMEQTRILENSKKIYGELKQTRLRKILFKALKDFETNGVNSSGLAHDEKEFYRSIVSLLGEYSRKNGAAQVRMKILADLPKIQIPGGSVIGPFAAGEMVSMDGNSAQMLLERKAAEKA